MTESTIKQLLDRAQAGAVKHEKKLRRSRDRAHQKRIDDRVTAAKSSAQNALEALDAIDDLKRDLAAFVAQCDDPEVRARLYAMEDHISYEFLNATIHVLDKFNEWFEQSDPALTWLNKLTDDR